MRRCFEPRLGLCALALSFAAAAQDDQPVRTEYLCLVDGGVGVRLSLADGEQVSCHIEASATRSRLMGGHVSPYDPAREVAVGSPEEARILRALERWVDQTFSDEEEARILALPRLPTPQTAEQQLTIEQLCLLRVLRRYQQVSRPIVKKVFAGRATVSLSLELTLGPLPPQVILWRRFENDEFARLHVATEKEPIAFDSPAESRILVALGNWLAARLGDRDAVWTASLEDVDDGVRLVLRAYRGYFAATAPRLRSSGVVMDQVPGGSRLFQFTDARNHEIKLRFDFAADTRTPGRLFEDTRIVEIGSPRETELLAMMRRAIELRRRWRGDFEASDAASALEEQLRQYTEAFHRAK